MQHAGIPHSQSYQFGQPFMTPERTPQHVSGAPASSYPMSPDGSKSGYLTEPRNYAPRTSGRSMPNEPPPKFQLEASPYQDPGQAQANNVLVVQGRCPETISIVSHPFPLPVASSSDIQHQRSVQLNMITNTASGLPTLATAMDPANFPFVESARQAQGVNHGIIKLKNIPFATKRSEVIAFLGRNSKILNDAEEPVHIIMEKVTSKTMDAYVEFTTLDDAMKAVEKHNQNLVAGRLSRLGDRPVDVELASEANLMKDLFPIAKGILWNGATPEFKPHSPREPWENFRGFISEEEMIMLVKHVEVPHRSPFSKECPQRPYECLISTLKKFPWYMTDRITARQRFAIFTATWELVRLLFRSLQKGDDPVNLTQQLHRRVVAAAMSCPGFSPLMKDDIAWTAGLGHLEQFAFGQPRFADAWRHQLVLAPKPGIPHDVIEWYVAVIREQTHRDMLSRPMHVRVELEEKGRVTDMYWGYFWAELGLPMGPEFDNLTLSQIAHVEFAALERILSRALTQY